jgi:hypothetical protein
MKWVIVMNPNVSFLQLSKSDPYAARDMQNVFNVLIGSCDLDLQYLGQIHSLTMDTRRELVSASYRSCHEGSIQNIYQDR